MNNTHVRLALFLGALGALGASGAFLGSVSGQASRYAWSLSDTRDGITLYTSDAPAHSYDAVKAVVTLAVAPDALVAVLREISAFPGWYAGCKQTRVLEAPRVTLPIQLAADGRFLPVAGQESFVLYFLQDLPVVNDRWAILRNTLRFGRDGSLTVEFHSLDRYPYKGPADTARMRVSGAWTLAPLSPTRTRVSFMLDIDPALSTPAFLVDPELHDIAVNTVAGLRAVARRRKVE